MGPARHTILFLVLTDTRGSLARSGEEKRAIGTWDVVACSGGRGEKEPFPRGTGSKRFFFLTRRSVRKSSNEKVGYVLDISRIPSYFRFQPFFPLLLSESVQNTRKQSEGRPKSASRPLIGIETARVELYVV